MQNPGRWFQEVGYLRAIAAIEVIVWSTTALMVIRTDWSTITLQEGLIVTIYAFTSFAVPLFIFISGFVLYNKYNKDFSLSKFYKKRFAAVLPPYLIFTAFYLVFPYIGASLYRSFSHRSTAGYYAIPVISQLVTEYVTNLVTGQALWFIGLLIQLYLLYPLLVRVYSRLERKNLFVLLLLFAQIIYVSLVTPMHAYVFQMVFLWGVFYFVLGFFVRERYETISQKITEISLKDITFVVVLSTVYYAVVFYYYSSSNIAGYWLYQITGPFYCLLLIVFYLKLGTIWRAPHAFTQAMEKISEDSFGIYLTQGFFVFSFAFMLPLVGLAYTNLLFYPILASLTLISSYLAVEAIYRLPFGKIIIGKPRKSQASVTQAPFT